MALRDGQPRLFGLKDLLLVGFFISIGFGGTASSQTVLLGLALIVLPGPFTLPLLVLGFAILGTEFAWAARALERVKDGMVRGAEAAKGAVRRVRRR